MKHWSLKSKIFCFFLPLTFASIILCFLVFRSLSLIDFNNSHILHLKDFQIQLKKLESWQSKLLSRDTTFSTEDFINAINKTKQMADTIASHHNTLPVAMHKELLSFSELSENFARSYLGLYERYLQARDLPVKTAKIITALRDKTESQIHGTKTTSLQHQQAHLLGDLVFILQVMQMEIHIQHTLENFKKHKNSTTEILRSINDPKAAEEVEQFFLILEQDFVNHLAILNREKFLTETAHYFFTTTDGTISSLVNRLDRQKKNYRFAILTITLSASLLNLLFWVLSSRYIDNFLTVQRKAMKFISLGKYDLQIDGAPNDEVGELSRTLQDLAAKLQRSQVELRYSEQRYRTLVEDLKDLLWEIDADQRFTFLNSAVQNLLGYRKEELLGTFFSSIVSEKGSDITHSQKIDFQRSLPIKTIISLNHKSGKIVIVEIEANPISKNGVFNGVRGKAIDITEKAHLEHQLLQSQKMESVGRLAGGVAHDYNNMLSVIIGYAEMGLEQVSTEDSLHHNLNEILDAALRSMAITRQLLAFAKKQTISPVIVDINDLISGMIKMLQRLIGENISLVWSPGNTIWKIKMDPSQVNQILANLCINAKDAINGLGSITIETRNRNIERNYDFGEFNLAKGEYVVLTITDDGCGMDTRTQEQIFEPFFSTKGAHGTGLGLSTVYGIIQQNKGFINVYSEPDKGTTFRIYLPKTAEAQEDEERAETGTENIPKGRGEKVLLVEDEVTITEMISEMLEKLGYQVLATSDPNEALELAGQSDGIELLITDVIMPGMDGKTLADKLSARYPLLKTLFISGYTADVIASQGVLHQGVHFLEKPFSRKELGSKIREVIQAV